MLTPCFWDNALGCYDPACELPPAHIYFAPYASSYASATAYADPELTEALTITTQTITSVSVYGPPTLDHCNCALQQWCHAGDGNEDSALWGTPGWSTESPPLGPLLGVYPNPANTIAAIGFVPDGFGNYKHIGDNSQSYDCTLVYTYITNVGYGIFADTFNGSDCCH